MKFLYKIKSAFLTFFGDIKVYPFPMFIVYCPDSFRVKGADTRDAGQIIQPGDLILRKYRHYLDGFFIPGEYSHTGIYIGDGKVVHAVAEGVTEIDLIDFLRCDGFVILRPRYGVKEAIQILHGLTGKPYDFNFCSDNESYYCHELAATAYWPLDIPMLRPSFFGLKLPFGRKVFLADSFLNSPDFKRILERKPSRKDNIMKKAFSLILVSLITAIGITGCATIKSAPAGFHDTAISFAKTTSKARAKVKINEMVEDGIITQEYGDQLLLKSENEIDSIFNSIDALYREYNQARAAWIKKSDKSPIDSDAVIYEELNY